MLPRHARLRRSQDFTEAVRRGARAGRPLLVVHLELCSDASVTPTSRPGSDPRAGFVVSKSVGNSVVRHAVSRKLRHVVRERLVLLPAGAHLVVRALAGAGTATSAQLAADLDAALPRALRKAAGAFPVAASETAPAGAYPR